MTRTLLVLSTCPEPNIARNIAEQAIEAKLAACVNILPRLQSIYTWQGKIENTEECLMIIKTQASAYSQLETLIKNNHPYDCPEILGIPIEYGMKGYLQWIEQSVLA